MTTSKLGILVAVEEVTYLLREPAERQDVVFLMGYIRKLKGRLETRQGQPNQWVIPGTYSEVVNAIAPLVLCKDSLLLAEARIYFVNNLRLNLIPKRTQILRLSDKLKEFAIGKSKRTLKQVMTQVQILENAYQLSVRLTVEPIFLNQLSHDEIVLLQKAIKLLNQGKL